MVPGRKQATVAYVDGTKWIGLDPATGKPRGAPIDLGFVPVRPVQYADFDGDGEPDVLATGSTGLTANQPMFAAFSLRTGRSLWSAASNIKYQNLLDPATLPDWPLVVDLDGDGRSEMVVPDSGSMPPTGGYRGMRVIDGAIRPNTLGAADAPGDHGRGRVVAGPRCARPRPRWRSRPGL